MEWDTEARRKEWNNIPAGHWLHVPNGDVVVKCDRSTYIEHHVAAVSVHTGESYGHFSQFIFPDGTFHKVNS